MNEQMKGLQESCISYYTYLCSMIDALLKSEFTDNFEKSQLSSRLAVFYGIGFISKEEYDKQYNRIWGK